MPTAPTPLPPARLAVLDRVRRGDHTVNTLAQALAITDNAVRLHLSALERDGLLRRLGVRRSGQAGQPAAEYDLTPQGELALSAAYPAALTALVTAMGAALTPRAARALFAAAGANLAAGAPHVTGSLAERAHACAALVESLGGAAHVTTGRGRATLIGAGCPLSVAVRGEPATCTLIEALLAGHSGLAVAQRCTHGDHPACRFEFAER